MRSEDLTPRQCRVLAKKFGHMQMELGRVKKRMRARSYPRDDKLQLLVLQAFDVMQELRMHVHYLGCSGAGGSGATEPPKFEGARLPTGPHDQTESGSNEHGGD
jgi:hypothetical protein